MRTASKNSGVSPHNIERRAYAPGGGPRTGEYESPAPAHEPTPRRVGGGTSLPFFALDIKQLFDNGYERGAAIDVNGRDNA